MSTGRDRDEPDEPSFADRADDVEPLAARNKYRRPPRDTPERPAAEYTRFEFPDPENPAVGFASGIQSRQLRRLRAGNPKPQRRIDLHGLRAEAARGLLLEELEQARIGGERCVLVVHGKGLHSAGEPVLRNALPKWLGDPRLEGSVLAFVPAQPEDGGHGASYVLLRRH